MGNNSSYHLVYKALFQTDPPPSVTWGSSQVDIINRPTGFMSSFDYTMQLQVGCPGDCLFCYVPASRE